MQPSFELFGTTHLVTLLVVVGAALVLPLAVRYLWPGGARPVAWALALLLVGQEGIQLRLLVERDGWTAQLLPLHLCAMAIYLTAWTLVTRNRWTFEIVYFWVFAGTTQALLTPDLARGFPAWEYVLFFLGHGLVVLGVTYAMIVDGLRPYAASIPRVAVVTLAFAALVVVVNVQLDTNFMYLMAKPDGASLMDALGPWPWYWLGLIALALLSFAILYAPWYLADRLRRRRPARG